jgi:hypothetical protein
MTLERYLTILIFVFLLTCLVIFVVCEYLVISGDVKAIKPEFEPIYVTGDKYTITQVNYRAMYVIQNPCQVFIANTATIVGSTLLIVSNGNNVPVTIEPAPNSAVKIYMSTQAKPVGRLLMVGGAITFTITSSSQYVWSGGTAKITG